MRGFTTSGALLALFSFLMSAPAVGAEPGRIVVPEVQVTGVSADIGTVVTELILEALLNRHGVTALGPSDFKDLLDQEQQKLLVGCDQNSCMAEIAGAMGAELLITGMVGKLGAVHVVTLKLIDTRTAKVAARASRRFQRIEDVPDAVGPLVDDLLQSKPRVRSATPMVLEQTSAPKKKPKTLPVRVLCQRAEDYAKALQSQTYTEQRVADRRAILEDMMHTPFLTEFDQKTSCARSFEGRTLSVLGQMIRRGQKENEVWDLRRRRAEWAEMSRLLDLLVEAYHTGYEKEKNGAGFRPSELPFEIKERAPERPRATPELERFLTDYPGAQKVLEKALVAGGKKREKAFRALWTPDDPERSRTSINYVWDQVVGYFKNGYQVDPCPIFILAASEIESSATSYAKKGELEACFRRTKGDYVTLDRVRMVHSDKAGWLIDRW